MCLKCNKQLETTTKEIIKSIIKSKIYYSDKIHAIYFNV